MKKILILLLIYTFPMAGIAEHKLPIANGKWFTGARLSAVNACGLSSYTYSALTTTPTITYKDKLAFSSAEHCARTQMSVSAISDEPQGFIGTHHDWQMISSQSQMPHSSKYTNQCLDKDNHVIAEKSLIAHPQYQCPVGSRYDVSDQDIGCNTTPTPCVGDVVAHDLFNKEIYFFGHVGMVGLSKIFHNPHTVLEIVNKPNNRYDNYVHQDTLKEFKENKYWGEKYGIHRKQTFTLNQGYHILYAGLEQSYFNSVYTFFWNSTPGRYQPHYVYNMDNDKFERRLAITQARFRCDGFVQYAYHKNNLDIIKNYGFPHQPFSMYNRLLSQRLPDADASGTPTEDPDLFDNLEKNIPKTVSIQSVRRQAVQSAGNDLVLLGKIQRYLDDPKKSKQSKVDELLKLIEELKNDPEQLRTVLDALLSLKPLRATEELMGVFYYSDNIYVKIFIIQILGENIRFHTQTEVDDFDPVDMDRLVGIQEFLADLFNTEQNKFVTREAFMLYSAVTPAQTAWDTFDTLIAAHPKMFSVKEIMIHKLALALATTEMQQKYFLPMLNHIQTEPAAQQALFNEVLNVLLRYIAVKDLDKPTLNVLQSYYQQIAPRDDLSNYTLHDARLYYDWLRGYAVVMTQHEADREMTLVQKIKSVHSDTLLSLLTFIADDHLLNHLSDPERAQIATRIKHATSASGTLASEKMYHMASLAKLENPEGPKDDNLPDPDF